MSSCDKTVDFEKRNELMKGNKKIIIHQIFIVIYQIINLFFVDIPCGKFSSYFVLFLDVDRSFMVPCQRVNFVIMLLSL